MISNDDCAANPLVGKRGTFVSSYDFPTPLAIVYNKNNLLRVL